MTRVTDEDLDVLKQYGAWTTDAVERMRHARCVGNVIAELLALRKVADAAKRYLAAYGEEDDGECQTVLDVMEMALRKAGL